MFKSEPNLFLRANNNVNSAKTLINECKRLIIDFDLEGNSACSNLKSNINSCNIDALVTRIENTKQSLMELDQGFASEYMMLLQEYLSTASMNTSNMTEEEMMQYSIYSRDYNQILLNMLEKYEESGMLTEEMKQQLEYQRQLVAQYELEDKMAVLDPSSDEYINLFKQSAGHNRNMIILNPSLTDEEKVAYLEQFDAQYNQNLESLISARNEKIQRKKDEAELQELYKFKEDNNVFFHPFVEDEINEAILDKQISMGIATEDEIEYKNMDSFDRFCADSKTFAVSTYTGLFNIVEGMTDGVVMLTSAFATEHYKNWAIEYTTRDISEEMYQGIQLSTGMNSYSAYGDWHEAGLVFGETAGKIGMTFAAPWVNAVMSGFKGMGQSAEASLLNGDDYEIAMLKGIVSGVAGASEGYGMSKLNLNIREFVSSGALKVFGKNAIAKLKNLPTVLKNTPLKTVIWNGVKTIVKNAGTSLGATLIDPDALIETGTVLASEFLDGVADGEVDTEKMFKEAGAVFITNWVMNGITGMAFGTSSGTVKGDVDTKVVNTNAEYMKKVNSVDKYKVKYNKELDFANDLKASGCTDAQIATQFAAKASQCSDIGAKKDLYDFAYKYLETSTGSPKQAEALIMEAFNGQLNARGMTTVHVDDYGIKYNDINKINNNNQAFTMEYIQKEIDSLPEPMRKSIKEINRYDTVNPGDVYWKVNYNNPNHYSAATGGNGQINIWANSSTYPTTISHEASHCFDTNANGKVGKYSATAEYKAAMDADFKYNNKKSVTTYGETNSVEDFAESMAHYLKDPDGFDFPNRKAYFEQILKNPDGNLVNTNVIDVNTNGAVTTSVVAGMSSQLNHSQASVLDATTTKTNALPDDDNFLSKIYDNDAKRVPGEKTVTTKTVENEILDFYNSAHTDETFESFDQLLKAHPEEVKAITYDNYRLRVLEDKMGSDWSAKERKKQAIDDVAKIKAKQADEGPWKDLSNEKRDYYRSKVVEADVSEEMLSKIYELNINSNMELADATIERVEKLIADGHVKEGFTSDQIIRMIQDDVPQTTYLKDSYVRDYYKKWNADPITGKVEVVMFQNGEGVNFSNCRGNIGPGDGGFVMPKAEAEAVIKKCTRPDGTINTDMLTKELGGVQFGENVIMITQEVDLTDISMPNGSLRTTYLGDWCPGGKTSGIDIEGCTEGIVKQNRYDNSNVKIEVIQGPKTASDFINAIK